MRRLVRRALPVIVSGLFVVSRSSPRAMASSSSARECPATIDSAQFYATYHGHRVEHLRTLHRALTDREGDARPRVVFLAGDSSLDNKHWLYRPSKKANVVRSLTARRSFIGAAVNGYEDVLTPPRSVKARR